MVLNSCPELGAFQLKLEFRSIQAMRGIAAMMVVAYHAAISAGLAADRGDADGSFLDAGVDIFLSSAAS